jgi:hypothetical protein
METNLTISRLAKSAQVNVETVRYYQRRGLMREPARRRAVCGAIQTTTRGASGSSSVHNSSASLWRKSPISSSSKTGVAAERPSAWPNKSWSWWKRVLPIWDDYARRYAN